MQLHISGHGLELTEGLKEHIQEKFARLSHISPTIMEVNITLEIKKNEHIAKANVHLPGTEIHSNETAQDMYLAVDHLARNVEQQILKHKEKLQSVRREGDSREF